MDLLASLFVGIASTVITGDTWRLDQRAQPPLGRWHPDWQASLDSPPDRLVLYITADHDDLRVRYELSLPRSHRLVQAVHEGQAEADPAQLARQVLGMVVVDESQLRLDLPEVRIDEGAESARLSLVGRAAPPTSSVRSVEVLPPSLPGACCVRPRKVVALLTGVRLEPVESSGRVIAQSADRVVLQGPATERLRFSVSNTRRPAEHLRVVLWRISDYFVPVISTGLYWLALSLPLLLLYRWHRKDRFGHIEILNRTAEIIRLLVASYLVLLAIDAIDWAFHSWRPVQLANQTGWPGGGVSGVVGSQGLYVLAAALVWPALAGARVADHPPKQRAIDRPPPMLLSLAVAILILPWVVVADGFITQVQLAGRFSVRDVLLALTLAGILFAVVYGVLRWLRIGGRIWKAMLATLLLVDLALLDELEQRSPITAITRYAIAIVAGALLVVAVANLLHWAARGERWRLLGPELRWSWSWWGWCVLLLFIVTPFPRLTGAPFSAVSVEQVRSLLVWFDEVIYIFIALVIVLALRQAGRDDVLIAGAREGWRDLGVLLLLVVLVDPHFRFVYLPIPFLVALVAYLFGRTLLFPQRQQELVRRARALERPRSWFVQKALDAARARRERRRLLGKVVDGDAEREQRRKRVAALEQELADNPVTRALGRRPERVALLLGPAGSAWVNGVYAARVGLLVSIPWIAFEQRDFFSRPLEDEYLILSLANSLLWSVIVWVVPGFFLGFFFPYLRGHSGLWKGFYLWLALFVPHMALAVLRAPSAAQARDFWIFFLFWGVRVFATLVLVGFLAGDLKTVRNAGCGPAENIELQNLGALVTWGSSVAASIAGALVTALSGELAEFARRVGPPGP